MFGGIFSGIQRFINFVRGETPPYVEGRLWYDDNDKALSFYTDQTGVSVQIGQETYFRVVNKTGGVLANGTVVYVDGAQGNRPTVAKAIADSYLTSQKTIGVATHDIADNAEGFVTTFGLVRDLNTSSYSEGDRVYLSSTVAGTFELNEPTTPNTGICVGTIVKSQITDGYLAVCIRQRPNIWDIQGDHAIIDDIPPIPLINARTPVANAPSLATFVGNIEQYLFQVGDYLYGNYEILHGWKEETPLYVHIHFANNGTNVDNRYVNWEFEYTIANRNMSSPSQFGTAVIISAEEEIPASTPDRTHFSLPIGTITMTGYNIGTYICWRLRRIASTGTSPTLDPFGLSLGIHHYKNTVGSRQFTSKD